MVLSYILIIFYPKIFIYSTYILFAPFARMTLIIEW